MALASMFVLIIIPACAIPQKGTLAAFSKSSGDQVKTSLSVAAEEVDFAKVLRIAPKRIESDPTLQRRLLSERESKVDVSRIVGPDGKMESNESYYKRTHVVPAFRYERGTNYVSGLGFPPGAISISGTWAVFGPQGESTGKTEAVWQWNVPAPFRKAEIVLPRYQKSSRNERFQTVLLATEKNHLLLLFDATRGLVWEKDIDSLISDSGNSGNGANPFGVVGIACSFDGAFTLVALNPDRITGEIGGRLLVFDQKGNLISQKEMPGTQIGFLKRNGSGYSFYIASTRLFEEGARVEGTTKAQLLFLRKDGQIAGVFAKEDDSLMSEGIEISDDDGIAIARASGSVFTLP